MEAQWPVLLVMYISTGTNTCGDEGTVLIETFNLN